MDKERWVVRFFKIILLKKFWNEFDVFSNFSFKSFFSKNLFYLYKVSYLIILLLLLIKGRLYFIKKNKKYCDKDVIRYMYILYEWKFVEWYVFFIFFKKRKI